jgi:hypothetical protein
VQNGDGLADLGFVAHNGTTYVGGAAFSIIVDGAPAGGQVPTKISLATNNGTSLDIRAELSSFGVWKTNSITALTTNLNLSIAANGTGNVIINNTDLEVIGDLDVVGTLSANSLNITTDITSDR